MISEVGSTHMTPKGDYVTLNQCREAVAAAMAKEREYSVAMDVAHNEATSDILRQLKTLTAERDALREALKAFTKQVNKIAWEMPPPNSYTPQFLMLCGEAERIAREQTK
jgi:hypothetical protein